MNSRNTKISLITLLILSFLIPNSSGFLVGGSILKGEVDPGQEFVHPITVKNEVDASPQNFRVGVYGFGISPTGGNIKYDSDHDTSPYSARTFLKATPLEFSLGPGESQKVLLEGKIPEDVGPGGRYAVVNIKTEPMVGGDVAVITAVDVPVMLTISGSELIETGEITDLEVSEGDEGPVARLMFENTGNHHYKAISEVVIEDESGEVLVKAATPLNPSSILPTNVRQFQIRFGQGVDLAPGTYIAKASVIRADGLVLDVEEATIDL